MLADENIEILVENAHKTYGEYGKRLENYVIAFESHDNKLYVAKNCQSVYGWHIINEFDTIEELKEEFFGWVENDVENEAILEQKNWDKADHYYWNDQ